MKHQTLIGSILISTILASSSLLAETANTMDAQQSESKTNLSNEQKAESDKAIKKLENQQNALLEVVNDSVADGFDQVRKATRLLQQEGKDKEAIAALEAATGKFDIALAANPELNLVPIDTAVTVSDLLTKPETLENTTDLAIDLLKDQKLQAARTLLTPLQDEMVTAITYLPMATYPDAIKLATKALVDGKREDARAILDTALSTFIVKESVIPLSLVRAESLLKKAADLDTNKDKQKITDYLQAAEEQLKIATLLGYTDKDSKAYENIKGQIKALKKAVKEDNAVEKMYKNLKSSLHELIGKHARQEPVDKRTDSGK